MPNMVAALRAAQHLTQSELARRVGISRPYLSNIERGKSKPTVEIAARICKALDADFERIFIDGKSA